MVLSQENNSGTSQAVITGETRNPIWNDWKKCSSQAEIIEENSDSNLERPEKTGTISEKLEKIWNSTSEQMEKNSNSNLYWNTFNENLLPDSVSPTYTTATTVKGRLPRRETK